MRMPSVYRNVFISFTQLDDVRSAINYTVEALKVGKHITLFSLLIFSYFTCPRLLLFNTDFGSCLRPIPLVTVFRNSDSS